MFESKEEALNEIFSIEDIENKISKLNILVKVSHKMLLIAMSKHSYTLSTELSVSPATAVKIVKGLWPDKPTTNSKVCGFLFNKYDLKYCSHCRKVKEIELFSKNSSRDRGRNSHCKSCYLETTREYQREYQSTREATKHQRTPSWSNLLKIKEIYKNCPVGHHVDHIVPLHGKLVSGLHVENNLQYLLAEDNLIKHNKFEVT